jgi:hypothetical protein
LPDEWPAHVDEQDHSRLDAMDVEHDRLATALSAAERLLRLGAERGDA